MKGIANPRVIFNRKRNLGIIYDADTQRHIDTALQGNVAEQTLRESNLRLVVNVARRYMGRGLSIGDLVQEGNIGLMRGTEKYDWRKGYRFSTYVYWWIRQAVTRAIAEQSRTIRLPVHVGEYLNGVSRTQRALEAVLGREPTLEEVAEKMETTVGRIEDTFTAAKTPVSIDTPIGEDTDATVGDMIPDTSYDSPDDHIDHIAERDTLDDALGGLTPRERHVVELRLGLTGDRLWTLSEIGAELGVTRERIRQIEVKAIRKLRHPSRSNELRALLGE